LHRVGILTRSKAVGLTTCLLEQDIKFGNVLVSHFAADTLYEKSQVRKRLQWSNELSYCLFDFDISMMLPADTDRALFRLPYRLSWDGSFCQPYDTAQGEFDYNPFAYDVGTLGGVLCAQYQVIVLLLFIVMACLNHVKAFGTANTHARTVSRQDGHSEYSITFQCHGSATIF
jgi:hypothetical protein